MHKRYFLYLTVLVTLLLSYTSEAQHPIFCKEGEKRPCGYGICRGFRECINGVWSETCITSAKPMKEICGNGIDEDCNGIVDDCEDITLAYLSYAIIGSGTGLFIFAIILSRIEARKMEEE